MYSVIVADLQVGSGFKTQEAATHWMLNLDPDFVEDFIAVKEEAGAHIEVYGPQVWNYKEWESFIVGL